MTKTEAFIQMLYGNKVCHEIDGAPLILNNKRQVITAGGMPVHVWFHGVFAPTDGWTIYDKS